MSAFYWRQFAARLALGLLVVAARRVLEAASWLDEHPMRR